MSAEPLTLRVELAVGELRLTVDETLGAGVTALFGASGSGKTTLLRAIAGLERPRRGRIAHGAAVWFDSAVGLDVAVHRRPVGLMFQDARLFPHLDVAGNLEYAHKRRHGAAGFDRDAVVEALDLAPLLSRSVGRLSGGERQRVALGRTLLRAPRLLLLDEPLAALDRARKADILPYLQRLPEQFSVPTIVYVSHDIDEVALLADRMLVLGDGAVQMHDSVGAVMERLDLEPITGRFDSGVLVEGRVIDHDTRLHVTHVDVGGDALTMPLLARVPVGGRARLRIRARDVALAVVRPQGLSIRNVLPGRLLSLDADPDRGDAEALVQLRGARIRARLTLAAVEALELEPGRDVFALIKSVSFEQIG